MSGDWLRLRQWVQWAEVSLIQSVWWSVSARSWYIGQWHITIGDHLAEWEHCFDSLVTWQAAQMWWPPSTITSRSSVFSVIAARALTRRLDINSNFQSAINYVSITPWQDHVLSEYVEKIQREAGELSSIFSSPRSPPPSYESDVTEDSCTTATTTDYSSPAPRSPLSTPC